MSKTVVIASDQPHAFSRWLWEVGPYIKLYQDQHWLVIVPPSLYEAGAAHPFYADLTLLRTLGIDVTLLLSLPESSQEPFWQSPARVQESRLSHSYQEAAYQKCWSFFQQVSQGFAVGLANTPKQSVRVVCQTGSWVTAKSVGVRAGIDYGQWGVTRKVDRQVQASISAHIINVVLPIGYSPAGDTLLLSPYELAGKLCEAIRADKLIIFDVDPGKIASQCTLLQSKPLDYIQLDQLDENKLSSFELSCLVRLAKQQCLVRPDFRTHLLPDYHQTSLLRELFTHEGAGVLLSSQAYEKLRSGNVGDIAGLLEMLRPLEQAGILVPRNQSSLEEEIEQFTVIERDGMIIGCYALYPLSQTVAEFACLAVHPEYQGTRRGNRLLAHATEQAKSLGCTHLVALTTHTAHWFLERGFQLAKPDLLPEDRRNTYCKVRNSKVFVKQLKN